MEQPSAPRSVGLAGWWLQLSLTADPHELLLCEYKAAGEAGSRSIAKGVAASWSLQGSLTTGPCFMSALYSSNSSFVPDVTALKCYGEYVTSCRSRGRHLIIDTTSSLNLHSDGT